MEIRVISYSPETSTVEVEVIVEKNKKSSVFPYTFTGIEQFSFRDIKQRIKADMKAKRKIVNNLTELYDKGKVKVDPERISIYGNVHKQ